MILVPYEAMQVMWSAVGYTPSPEQEPIHRALAEPPEDLALPRLIVLAGGEQAGKSTTAAEHVLSRWMVDEIIWLVGNRYEDCKAEYQYIRDQAVACGAARPKDCSYSEDGPWALKYINGNVVKVLSSEDVTKLAREAPSGVVMCEPGRQSHDAFLYAWRRVVPRNGWMLVAGTFEGTAGASRWYPDLWRECQGDNPYGGRSMSLPSYSNRTLYPQGSRDPKFLAACKAIRDANPMEGEEEIAERFLGIPRVPKGLVFTEFRRKLHVRDYADFVPELPVTITADPGYYPSAYAVNFIQNVQGQDRCFGELYLHHMTNDEAITLAESFEVDGHPVFRNVTSVVLDVAAKQHAGAQGSAYETWVARMGKHTANGRRITISGQRVAIEDRNSRIHDRLRTNPMTGEPLLVFHPRCKMSIFEFEEGYRLRERHNGQIGSDNPIDRDNHAVAAIGYYIVDRYGYTDLPRARLPQNTTPASPYAVLGRQRAGAA